MSREDTVFETGDVVADRYEIVEELGRGSYGVVYRAIQLGIGRDVALKTLLPQTPVDSEEHQRFEREALVVSRFNHPNIVTLFDYGEHEGVLFMVMEYIEGRPLREIIDQEAPLAPDRIRAITGQILDALQYAHDDSIVHRDLKPANIQLLQNPSIETYEAELVKVLDFGIAKLVHGDEDPGALDTLTQTGIAMGTPQYMSPENITGDPVTHHADLYAVGLLIYEMLTGEVAFEGEDPQDVMVAHIKDPPPGLPDRAGAESFVRAVDGALRKQPDERIQTARQFRNILDRDAPATESSSQSTVTVEENRILKPLVAVTVAAAVVILLLAAIVVFGDGEPREEPTAGVENSEQTRELEQEVETEGSISVDRAVRAAGEAASEADGEQSAGADREVELEITSDADPARVIIDGEAVGSTPLSRRLPRDDQPVRVEVRGEDDREAVVRVVPDSDRSLEVELD